MPEGSLSEQITALTEAFSGLLGVVGQAPEGDGPGTGLAGAASLTVSSPAGGMADFSVDFGGRLSGIFDTNVVADVAGLADVLGSLDDGLDFEPTAVLSGFEGLVDGAAGAFGGEFAGRIGALLEAVRGISEGIPASRVDVLESLIDQLLGLLDSLGGSEAERILAWIRSIEAQRRELMPLFEQLGSAPDPSAVVLQIFERTLGGILELFGPRRLRGLFQFLDEGPEIFLPRPLVDGVSVRLDAVFAAYGEVRLALAGDLPELGLRVAAAHEALFAFKAELRPVAAAMRRVTRLPVVRPGGLAAFLRRWMDEALAIRVEEVQKIDDPYGELLDRIDTAIEGIDLSFVRDEVLGFFETTRETLEAVRMGSIGDVLDEQITTVEDAVTTLRDGVTDFLDQIRGFFDNLVGSQRELLGELGTFQPDGSFQFRFEDDLRGLFTTARSVISGDVAGSLEELRSSIDGFLQQLDGLLAPLEGTATTVTDAAAGGIETFVGFLEGLDIPGLMERLRGEVDAILEALVPIDFALVIDPVIEEIEAATEDLAEIDPEPLSDLVKLALAAALELITGIEFSVTISAPLTDGFATIKAVPAGAIEDLQARYEAAIDRLGELGPERLIEALTAALDTLTAALDALRVETLLEPLDRLHDQALRQPLARLRPSLLLEPLADAFGNLLSVFDGLQGETLLAPLVERLEEVKSTITAFDITGELDELLATVEGVKEDLRAIRPSVLLEPVVRDLGRIEAELDRFKPSVVFAPVADLAEPLLEFLENVGEELTTGLFELFQEPLRQLDRLEPEALVGEVRAQIDVGLEILRSVDLPARLNQLKALHFDLNTEVRAGGVEARVDLVAGLDPEPVLGAIVATFRELIDAVEGIRANVELAGLEEIYSELRERLLAMLPPYARELLDPETFRRLMRQANPLRFVEELDARFEEIKGRLLPIRPADISGELDATYEAVLALVDGLEIGESLNRVRETFERVRGIVDGIRIDFLAADIDAAVANLRAVVEALDPARLGAELDALHAEVEAVVATTVPSVLLAGLDEPLARIRGLIEGFGTEVLVEPIELAWEAVDEALGEVNVRLVLKPLLEKLDELEAELIAGLQRTETAFDRMLGAAQSALEGGGFSVEIDLGGLF